MSLILDYNDPVFDENYSADLSDEDITKELGLILGVDTLFLEGSVTKSNKECVINKKGVSKCHGF